MDIAEMKVHDWRFQLINNQLLITSEQNPDAHLELSAHAAFSLLDYLYQYRDDLSAAAKDEEKAINTTEQAKPLG
ncbi:MAG: hypothetical protein ABI396_03630 [Ktedonobacteraceae bacterium]